MAFTPVPNVTDGDFLVDDWGNAVAAAVDELQSIASAGTTGADATGPTSGTIELVIKTMNVPATGKPGRIHVWGETAISAKTVATDRFDVGLKAAGVLIGKFVTPAIAAVLGASPTGSVATDGLAAVSLTMHVVRVAGTGTATMSSADTSMHWIFIPAP